jgi:membrane-bound lytic murein transglycosylase B
MKRLRKRTTHQRRAAKFRKHVLARVATEIAIEIRQHAVHGTAYTRVDAWLSNVQCEMRLQGFSEEDIEKAINKARSASGVEYRAWLAQEIRREAWNGNAYGRFVSPTSKSDGPEMTNLQADMDRFGIEPEHVRYEVHDAVTAVMRPARRHSDVV